MECRLFRRGSNLLLKGHIASIKLYPRKIKRSDMWLSLKIEQKVSCEAVVKIAEHAAEAILRVYDSEVSNRAKLYYESIHMLL